jgi:PPOX class probable F420-dependent enzyme
MLDLSTEFGRRVDRRLKEELIIWLTTVGEDQAPHPRPVWFFWDGETFLIYSQPEGHKLRHIVRYPRVSLNFNGDDRGGDIIVFTGKAEIDTNAPRANEVSAFIDKYQEDLERLGTTADEFANSYSSAIRVKPARLRGH